MHLTNFILGSFTLLIQQYADYYRQNDLNVTLSELRNDLSLPCIQTYDYIVVGGGSAGCIMASRLSEKYTVLLLESGGDPPPTTYVQYLDSTEEGVFYHPAINNIFYSVPHQHFFLKTGGVFRISTGRMLGGSGSHNVNLYNRGSPEDYNNFAKLTQDPSWSYANVLKYFKRMENYVGKLIREEEREAYYGTGGPITVVTDISPPRLTPTWLTAGQELGYTARDPNGHQEVSFAPVASSIRSGVKDDSYISYIKPIESSRQTLKVLRFSNVEKVLIRSGQAYGVTYVRHGIPQIAHASQEVILSGGTIATPLLLIKSGLGPRSVLQEAGIQEVVHLPGVGQNLHDHSSSWLEFSLEKNSSILPLIQDTNIQEELLQFQELRQGLFSTPIEMGQAFLASSRAVGEGHANWPDLHLLLQQNFKSSDFGTRFKVNVALGRPKSVGNIGFNATAFRAGDRNDTKLAIIDHKFYSEPSDMDVLVEGMTTALNLVERTDAFSKLGVKQVKAVPDGCKGLKFRSQEFWRCYVQYICQYWFHLAGTAKMGVADDPMAVVDSKLRVRGVSGLRVVDASIFPRVTNTNLNAPTMMVAEKVADQIMGSVVKTRLQP